MITHPVTIDIKGNMKAAPVVSQNTSIDEYLIKHSNPTRHDAKDWPIIVAIGYHFASNNDLDDIVMNVIDCFCELLNDILNLFYMRY